MMSLSQSQIQHLEQVYDKKIVRATPIGSVIQITTSDDKKFVVKTVKNKELMNIYYFLLAQKFTNFITPEPTIYRELFTSYNNEYFYIIPWFEDIDYPIERKLIDYIDLLYKLHKSTTIRKNFNKSQFMRLYKKKLKQLDRQFQLLDLYIVEVETKQHRSIFDWTYLVKYNEIMYIKNILLNLQTKIEDLIEKQEQYDYCIIHNNPNIDHFVVTNEKNYLISFDYSTIGFKVHDYIKLFIDYSEYDVDWMTLIINDNIQAFEFYYFIFNVLFFIIKNMEITFLSKNNNFESINIFIHNLFVAIKAIELYNKYEALNSSTEKEE